MSKPNKSLVAIVSVAALCAVLSVGWISSIARNQSEADKIKNNNTYTELDREPEARFQSGRENAKLVHSGEPVQTLKWFNGEMKTLRNSRDGEWAAGLTRLAGVVNVLGKQPDFESFTASALMTKALSDISINRLMNGEIEGDATLRGIEKIHFIIPSDEKLIDFICQYYSNGAKEKERLTPDSVMEFVSRFEPDDEFPNEHEGNALTAIGLITEKKATLSLFAISGAKQRLDLARVTALYIAKGGDFNLRGKELAAELEAKVGEEATHVTVPKFFEALGNLKPTVFDISEDIEMTLYEYGNK